MSFLTPKAPGPLPPPPPPPTLASAQTSGSAQRAAAAAAAGGGFAGTLKSGAEGADKPDTAVKNLLGE